MKKTIVTKSFHTLRDVITAYTSGVCTICEGMTGFNQHIYLYTNKGNLVRVISYGTTVLGYGNIGPLAAKAVMETKAMILKKFAAMYAFDIKIDASTPEAVIEVTKALTPSFGSLTSRILKHLNDSRSKKR